LRGGPFANVAPQIDRPQDAAMEAPASTGSSGLAARAMRVGVAATAGLVAGALVGGLGGRLAMLLLRLTSDPSVRGLETDDGFTIGVVSPSTMFLVVATAVLGVIGGLVYLVVRTWLPGSSRSLWFGALTGVVGGAVVIRPGGIDFTLLDPLWLAIALFVALPGVFGVVVAALVERWLRGASAATSVAWLAGIALAVIPVALLGARGAITLAAALIVLAVLVQRGPSDRISTSPTVLWLGRAGLLAVGVVSAAALVIDVAAIL
jgi:hypothetical protein